MNGSFMLNAYNVYDSINLKTAKTLLRGKVVDTSPAELQVHYGDDAYLFVYRFGTLVAFNMPEAQVQGELAALKAALGPGLDSPTAESLPVLIGGPYDRIEFEGATFKKFSRTRIGLVAMTVAQSAALEHFELHAAQMLSDTVHHLRLLGRRGRIPSKAKVLLKFIGVAATTRQDIVSNLAILDPPEQTWRNRELQRLFRQAQLAFDIDVRFRALDRKLSLVQDNIAILSDLVATRRANLLEAAIVLLIVFEIVMAGMSGKF